MPELPAVFTKLMSFPIHIEVPQKTTSLNVWERWHWSQRRLVKELWDMELFVRIHKEGRKALIAFVAEHRPKIRCRIVQRRKRLLDEDNFIGGLKPLIDGIKNNKYIVDDRPEFFTLDPKPIQEKAGKAREITIIELDIAR